MMTARHQMHSGLLRCTPNQQLTAHVSFYPATCYRLLLRITTSPCFRQDLCMTSDRAGTCPTNQDLPNTPEKILKSSHISSPRC